MATKVRSDKGASGVERSRARETGGFSIAGSAGAGKTALLNDILKLVMPAQALTRRTRQHY